jgi:predicted Zn-dependent peptidase
MVKEVRNIRRQVLPHGLTVITEQMEHIRSASIGIWLETGSRDETPQSNGISHFIEHMVFKGTKHRSAEEIARQVDSIGGNMDAFTSKECICFNVKVLDENVPVALEILTDLVLHPTFTAEDIARERGVILEEIKMMRTTPITSSTKSSPRTSGKTTRSVSRFWEPKKPSSASSVKPFSIPICTVSPPATLS